MSDNEPETLVAAKNSSPLVVGLGDGENFVASDVTAILAETRNVIFIEEGEIVTVTREAVTITDFDGKPHVREPKTITWSAVQAEKGGFKHFMLKEIHEQPRAVADTLVGRVDLEHDDVLLDGIELDVAKIKRIVFIACGTSYHASMVGEFLVEALARIPVEVDLALGVPLSRSDRRAGRPRGRGQPVGRDARYDGGGARGKEEGRTGARDLERARVVDPAARGLRVLHARGSRDRRRLDQGVHHAARRDRRCSRSTSGRRTKALSKERARALLAELVQLPQQDARHRR